MRLLNCRIAIVIILLLCSSCRSSKKEIQKNKIESGNSQVESTDSEKGVSNGVVLDYAELFSVSQNAEINSYYVSNNPLAKISNLIEVRQGIYLSVAAENPKITVNEFGTIHSYLFDLDMSIKLPNDEVDKIRLRSCELILGDKKVDLLLYKPMSLEYSWRNESKSNSGCCYESDQKIAFEETKELQNKKVDDKFIDSFVLRFKALPIDISVNETLQTDFELEIMLKSGERRNLQSTTLYSKSTKDPSQGSPHARSSKGRGFCPSCTGRRMADTSARLVDNVFPGDVPVRQWVLSLPIDIRLLKGAH